MDDLDHEENDEDAVDRINVAWNVFQTTEDCMCLTLSNLELSVTAVSALIALWDNRCHHEAARATTTAIISNDDDDDENEKGEGKNNNKKNKNKKKKELRKLYLDECSFVNSDAVKRLVQFLYSVGPQLQELIIEDRGVFTYRIDGNSIALLLDGIINNNNCNNQLLQLRSLGLYYMELSGENMQRSLRNLLEHVHCPIQELSLYCCRLGDDMYRGLVHGIRGGGSCNGSSSLTRLRMDTCRLDDAKFQLLATALTSTVSLMTELHLWGNATTADSIPALIQVLKHCRNLEKLSLSLADNDNTTISHTEEHDTVLNEQYTDLVASLCNLKAITIRLKDELETPLFQLLAKGDTKLERLDIRGGDVSTSLTSSLASITSLLTLRAKFDPRSRPALQRAFWSNTSLTFVENFHFHGGSARQWNAEMAQILRRNRLLRKALRFLETPDLRSQLSATTWPLCAHELLGGGAAIDDDGDGDDDDDDDDDVESSNSNNRPVSGLFTFLVSTNSELFSWMDHIPNKNKRRIVP